MNNTQRLEEILNLVSEFCEEEAKNKEWVAGKDWVQYAGPFFDSEEYINATKALLSGWLILSKDGNKFEKTFAKHLGKKYGTLTNSGSSANLLMLSMLTSRKKYNLQRGTKVITSIAGFPTTINPIIQLGFEPVFVDIDLPSLNINLDQVEEKVKQENIKVMIFAHAFGNPPNMDHAMSIVKENDLILLEDCCDALNSTYDGKLLGSFGHLSSCSFFPAHHITMGEGGFVASNDLEHERIVRSFRDWGRGCFCAGQSAAMLVNGACKKRFSEWLPSLAGEIFDHKYVYEEIGYNLKPIEIQAAIGLAQIKKIKEITKIRKDNYDKMFQIFEKYEEYFYLPVKEPKSDPNWFAFPITIKDSFLIKREAITQFFESAKIQTRTFFGGNLMLQPAYSHIGNTQDFISDFPNATKATKDTFFLGTSPVITDEQISYIGEILDKFMKKRLMVI